MAKILQGEQPKTFKRIEVKFAMPDGSEGVIPVTYKYRTRTGYGEMLNQAQIEAGKGQNGGVYVDADGKPDYKAMYTAMGSRNADHLLDAIDSWGIDEPLNRETLAELADQLPAAAVALMHHYNVVCTEGRLGN
jgi:hypothetical protein